LGNCEHINFLYVIFAHKLYGFGLQTDKTLGFRDTQLVFFMPDIYHIGFACIIGMAEFIHGFEGVRFWVLGFEGFEEFEEFRF
jgi:hypothetical protein